MKTLLTPICWFRYMRYNWQSFMAGRMSYPISGHIMEAGTTREADGKVYHTDFCMMCGRPEESWHDEEMKDVWPCCEALNNIGDK